jgi:DNA (cytosine-5)-methyltransferase 1
LSLGFEQAGFDVLASVEYDPIHTAVHRFNFPRTATVCADASTVTAKSVRAAVHQGWNMHGYEGDWDGSIDVVVGGPPCQGFSVIGRRAFDDPRNQLARSFVRLVGSLKPRYFVMENVPGMTSVRAGQSEGASRFLDLLVEELEDGMGYRVADPEIVNAYNFGVPQDRRRLILLGAREGEAAVSYPAIQTRGRSRRGAELNSELKNLDLPLCPTVWDAVGNLPDLDRFETSRLNDEVGLSPGEVATMDETASAYARVLGGVDTDPDDYSWPRTWDRQLLTSSYRTVHDASVKGRFRKTPPGRPESVSRLFRLHRSGVSSTLRAGTHYERGSFNAPRPIHPTLARVISVREAARLHSFPDWFRLHWTKWHGFRQVGNSLPPRVGRAVGAEIVHGLGISPAKPDHEVELGDRGLLYLENLAAAKQFEADLSRIPRNSLRTRPTRRTRDRTKAVQVRTH